MELKKLVGKKIQKIRKQRGITQEKLAEMIGIEVPSLSNIETGKFSPSIDTLQKLSSVLNVSPWEFYYINEVSLDEMKFKIKQSIEENPKVVKLFYNLLQNIDF